jgi:hypothetical protein
MHPIKNRRIERFVTFLSLGLAVLALASRADAKPNFGGEWKLNVSKSEYGPMPAPNKRTDKITHEDPKLKITTSQSGQNGDFTFDLNYSTDGKETSNDIRGNAAKSTAKWDGDALLIETKANFQGNDVTLKDKWMLSDDGKTLTINRHIVASQGELDTKMVLEKQ